MAEAIISTVSLKLDGLLNQPIERMDLFPTGFKNVILRMSDTLKNIQAVVADAEHKKFEDDSIKVWLKDLQDVSYEIDGVLEDCNNAMTIHLQQTEGSKNRVRFSDPSSCFRFTQVVWRRDIRLRIKKLKKRLESIGHKTGLLGLLPNLEDASSSPLSVADQSNSYGDFSSVVGRDSEKRDLIEQLLSESPQEEENPFQIVSLAGMGGVGKTTLAQMAYNDELVKGHFETMAWVCVSDPFDEFRIAKAILQQIQSSPPNFTELNSMLEKIQSCISGKKFLLVLDDVWTTDHMQWQKLKRCLKYGARGSKILLTTRSEDVAIVAGSTRPMHLSPLSDDANWSLFCKIAFSARTGRHLEDREIVEIGMRLFRRCAMLPLAAISLAGLLRNKSTVQEWLAVAQSRIWVDSDTTDGSHRVFLASYNDMAPPLRRCFSYCAVFPKDEEIRVPDLIKIWMAQDYLDSSSTMDEMEILGMKYFRELSVRSFFHNVEQEKEELTCKMHDLVHDFALEMASGECLTISGDTNEVEFLKKCRHVSWIAREEAFDIFPNWDMGQLRSFFAKDLRLKPKLEILGHLLDRLKLVRVLKLESCGLEKLPEQIKNLIYLRYLGLGLNELRELPPTVYMLYNLQTLDIQGNRLSELPPGIGKLLKLRHLIHSIIAMKYPTGFEKLKCLQALGYILAGKEYNKLEDLKSLNKLRGSLEITIVDDSIDETDAKNAQLEEKEHLESLTLSLGFKEEDAIVDALEPPNNLQSLTIQIYGGTKLPRWIPNLKNLRHLVLKYFFKMKSLPQLGGLEALEKLQIMSFPQLKFMGPTLMGKEEPLRSPPAIEFPKLTELHFVLCKQWEEWKDITPEEEAAGTVPRILPRLHRLVIDKCPKLKSLPCRLLRKAPLLECIELDGKEQNVSTILSTNLPLADSKEPMIHLGPNSTPEPYPDTRKNNKSSILYYMRRGRCRFGASRKYHHSRQKGKYPTPVTLNIYGYPSRPGEKERSYYKNTEQLNIHVTCKFRHPKPASVQEAAATPGSGPLSASASEIHPAASSSTRPTTVIGSVDEIKEHPYAASSAGPSGSSQKELGLPETKTEVGKLKMKQVEDR